MRLYVGTRCLVPLKETSSSCTALLMAWFAELSFLFSALNLLELSARLDHFVIWSQWPFQMFVCCTLHDSELGIAASQFADAVASRNSRVAAPWQCTESLSAKESAAVCAC